MTQVDLKGNLHVHIVGIGGAGMSAIAEVLAGSGHRVSGSDLRDSVVVGRLRDRGIEVRVGHDGANLPAGVDLVTHSTAIPNSNPELLAAHERSIPVLRRAEMLAAITRVWKTLAVAGTHGKTTTSAMLTVALRGAGFDPAFIVGGDLKDLDRGAAVGSGEYLVVEADESDGTFVELDSYAIVVTNVEPDHLEHYGGFEGLKDAFARFVAQADGPKVICADDPGSAELARMVETRPGLVTYGVSAEATWRIIDPVPTPTGVRFGVEGRLPDSGEAIRVELNLAQPGMHNARNATAALVTAVELGADPQASASALSNFGGVGRRFEPRGQAGGVVLVDDYAHLPTEVEAALAAARSLDPERLVVVFQPHRYSRTEQLWTTFGDAFEQADVLFVTGIYPSGEAPRPGITGKLIADIVLENHPDLQVRYIETLDQLVPELSSELTAGDLCITLGAGDLTTIPDRVLAELEDS